MATLFEKLQTANLPVISATEQGQIVMGAMTPVQEEVYYAIVYEHTQPVKDAEYNAKIADKAGRNTAVASRLASLSGRNISTINNNADRDTMNQATWFLLGLCDKDGIILAQPAEAMVPQNKQDK